MVGALAVTQVANGGEAHVLEAVTPSRTITKACPNSSVVSPAPIQIRMVFRVMPHPVVLALAKGGGGGAVVQIAAARAVAEVLQVARVPLRAENDLLRFCK